MKLTDDLKKVAVAHRVHRAVSVATSRAMTSGFAARAASRTTSTSRLRSRPSATQPVEAARCATSTIPIVMPNHSDPIVTGMVTSLARPGGNVTGLSIQNPELMGKRLELIKETIPRINHVAMLWNPTHEAHPRMIAEGDAAALGLTIPLFKVSARGSAEYPAAFAAMARERVDALLVLGDQGFWRDRTQLASLAERGRLPTMFAQREHVEAGGLMHYGPDLRDSYRRAPALVDKILQGAKPGDLPIEQPRQFEFVINLKTAKALGLTIPQCSPVTSRATNTRPAILRCGQPSPRGTPSFIPSPVTRARTRHRSR